MKEWKKPLVKTYNEEELLKKMSVKAQTGEQHQNGVQHTNIT